MRCVGISLSREQGLEAVGKASCGTSVQRLHGSLLTIVCYGNQSDLQEHNKESVLSQLSDRGLRFSPKESCEVVPGVRPWFKSSYS